MELFFLEAAVPLTKTFTIVNGELDKSAYPKIKNFTSHVETINTPEELFKAISDHAALGHCMLKGTLHKKLVNESRAGTTLADDKSELLVYDLDNLQNFQDAEDYMQEIGAGHVSYTLQWSASSGVDKKKTGMSAHIYVLVPATSAKILKNYLTHLNLSVDRIRPQVSLTESEVSLSYPVDPTVGQNDKLLYIAAPICGAGVVDPLGARIQFVKKDTDVFVLPADIPNLEATEKARKQHINELRILQGIPAKKTWKMKQDGGMSYMPGATACQVTGMKSERGYTYFNVNFGDSWAYYHLDGHPKIISSFKGDGPYLTKEFLPEYWQEISKGSETAIVDNKVYMAYRHFKSSNYYNLIYDKGTHEIKHAKAGGLMQLQHFMEQYDIPWSGVPTDWDHIYEPAKYDDFDRININNKTINLYTPPPLAAMYDSTKTYALPELIWKVILHACGGHEVFAMHVINGWAYQLQTGEPVSYAVVLQGTTGTGKGVIINEILTRVFGPTNITIRKATELNEPYNSYMENAQIVCYEEADMQAQKNVAAVSSMLKNSITEPTITIRNMYQTAYSIPRKCSLMFLSNESSPVHIARNDRRFNVGEYQGNRISLSAEDVADIRDLCEEFRGYLLQFSYDEEKIRQIVATQAHEDIIHTSALGVDEFLYNLTELGSFQFLLDQLPQEISMDVQNSRLPVKEYGMLLYTLFSEIHAKQQSVVIFREELRLLLSFNFPNVPIEPYKFSSFIKHHRVLIKPVRRGTMQGRGITVNFRFSDDELMYCNMMFSTVLRGLAN